MKPAVPNDQGPLKAALSRVPDRRAMVLDMGKPVTFILLTPEEADALVAGIRAKAAAWFGPVQHGATGLARFVRCDVARHHGLVHVAFLPPSGVGTQGMLAAGPEVFLALADAIEAARRSIRTH